MEYKVLPFSAGIKSTESVGKAAQQLSDIINEQAENGWRYLRMETLVTSVTTPGSSGCFGFGSTPAVTDRAEVYVIVFGKG